MKNWRIERHQFDGRQFKFFKRDGIVLVCGGIGTEASHRAAEAVINIYHPILIQSVGFAGALDPKMKVGNIFTPAHVIDGNDGSRIKVGAGTGTLLSVSTVAGVGQKEKFANDYGANAIDMEAAAVAHEAQSHGIRFQAVKAISDEYDFEMPPINRFIRSDGGFRSVSFAGFVAVRPWLWNKALRLARNSEQASRSLCQWLNDQQTNSKKLDYSDVSSIQLKENLNGRRLNK